MKTPEEKIHFKNHFFKLGQGRLILKEDVDYWHMFWSWPTAASHVFDLLTPYDIQTVRDHNLPNFLTLVHVLGNALINGQKGSIFSNCAQMLSKILPFLFEMPDYERIERRVFLVHDFDPMSFANKNQYTRNHPDSRFKPCPSSPDALAPALIRALVDNLLGTGEDEIWEVGLGKPGSYAGPDIQSDISRADTIRLLLVLISRQFYETPRQVKRTGNIFLSLLVTALGRIKTNLLVCSLINIVCRAGRVSRGDSGLENLSGSTLVLRHSYVLMCGQLLTSAVLYTVPHQHQQLVSQQSSTNMVSDHFSSLSTAHDLSFIASHLLAILRSPFIAENGNSSTDSSEVHHNPSPLTLSAMLILRELYENNSAFQESVAARLAVKLVPCVLYHIYAYYDRPEYAHSVKLASCFLVDLSGKESLNRQFLLPMQEQFPPEFRVGGPVSTRDFAVMHICRILLTLAPPPQTVSKYTTLPIRQFLLTRLTEFLYNVIPCTTTQIPGTDHAGHKLANINPGAGISYRACTLVNSVVSAFSTKQFLVANSSHPQLLALLLRALCSTVTKHPASARMLLVTFLENEAMYDHIWTTVQELSQCYFVQSTLCEVETIEGEPKEMEEENLEGEEEKIETPFKDSLQNSLNSLNSLDSMDSIQEESAEDGEDAEDGALTPVPPAGMSEQRKQKWPQETPISETWGGTGSLHIIVVIFIPFLKQSLGDLWCKRGEKTAEELYAVAQAIGRCDLQSKVAKDKKFLHYDSWPETPVHTLSLSWNSESLGWLAGVVGWDVYAGADTIRSYVSGDKTIMGNISSSLAMFTKFASGWSSFGVSTSNSTSGGPEAASVQEDTIAFTSNLWAASNIRLFQAKVQDRRLFGLRLSSVGSPGSVNDITSSIARKFRLGSRSSASSAVSTPTGFEEMPEFPKLTKRDSVSSLHSLNTLNRARSYTPRSSFSNS